MSYDMLSKWWSSIFPPTIEILSAQNDNCTSEFDEFSNTLDEMILEEKHMDAFIEHVIHHFPHEVDYVSKKRRISLLMFISL